MSNLNNNNDISYNDISNNDIFNNDIFNNDNVIEYSIVNDIENNIFNSHDNVELTLYNDNNHYNSGIIRYNFTRIVINYYNKKYFPSLFNDEHDNDNIHDNIHDNVHDTGSDSLSDTISVIENSSFTCTNDSDSSPEEMKLTIC